MSGKKLHTCVAVLRNLLILMISVSIIIIYLESTARQDKISKSIRKSALPFITFDEPEQPLHNVFRLRRLIREANKVEAVLNINTYGPIKINTIILVINVSKLTEHLKFLVASLGEVRGIEEVLIIFSHSYYDKTFNNFISLIDFCRVIQIFYPHSVQANPDSFPGYDPNDCPSDMPEKTAQELNCTGAFTPDVNGKYRQPHTVERKNHWWWTANKIFEDMNFSADYEGIVVFLEDDLYVLEDFLYMVIYMSDAAESVKDCDFISLGQTHARPTKFELDEDMMFHVSVVNWDPERHSSALAFKTATWEKIITHYDMYCNIDDSSWARSLLQVSLGMIDNNTGFKVMVSDAPRAYKTSHQGYYAVLMSNSPLDTVFRAIDIQQEFNNDLYPIILEVYTEIEPPSEELQDLFYSDFSGGFSDPRDRMLCGNITMRKIKKELFESAMEFRHKLLLP